MPQSKDQAANATVEGHENRGEKLTPDFLRPPDPPDIGPVGLATGIFRTLFGLD